MNKSLLIINKANSIYTINIIKYLFNIFYNLMSKIICEYQIERQRKRRGIKKKREDQTNRIAEENQPK